MHMPTISARVAVKSSMCMAAREDTGRFSYKYPKDYNKGDQYLGFATLGGVLCRK